MYPMIRRTMAALMLFQLQNTRAISLSSSVSSVCLRKRVNCHVRCSRGLGGRELPRTWMDILDLASSRTTEEQDIAIGVLELEATQTVISVFQRLGKLDITRSKF